MVGMTAPDSIDAREIPPRNVASSEGADDWMLSDTAEEWETADLSDTAESMVVHEEEPGRDTIPSPPPENGVEATPVTIPAPPPLGEFDHFD